MTAFRQRVQEKIMQLRGQGKEDRARTLEAQLARVDAAIGDEELTKLPEAA